MTKRHIYLFSTVAFILICIGIFVFLTTISSNPGPKPQEPDPLAKLKSPSTDRVDIHKVVDKIVDHGPKLIPNLIDFLNEKVPKNQKLQGKQITAKETALSSKKLQKKLWPAKVASMNILAEWKAEEALETLREMLTTSDGLSAIYNSARTIGRIGGDESYQILLQVFEDAKNSKEKRSNDRKKAAILGLGLCGDSRSIPLLKQELLNQENKAITRVYAASSLGLFGNSEGLEFVTEEIDSDDPAVKLHSIEALGFIGSTSSLDILKELVESKEKYVYKMAAKTSIIQIEASHLVDNAQIQYIHQKLIDNPRVTELVWWGTSKLKQINNKSSRSVLESLSQDANHLFLKSTASMKLKTIK